MLHLVITRTGLADIGHFEMKQYECAMTLAGAGESILPDNSLMHLFNVLTGKFTGRELNLFRNWLKHATGAYKITIDELEVVVAISRAIQKFVVTYEESHPDFQKFSDWAIGAGYIKTPLIEKAGRLVVEPAG